MGRDSAPVRLPNTADLIVLLGSRYFDAHPRALPARHVMCAAAAYAIVVLVALCLPETRGRDLRRN